MAEGDIVNDNQQDLITTAQASDAETARNLLEDSLQGDQPQVVAEAAEGEAPVSPGQHAAEVNIHLSNVDGVVNGHVAADGSTWGDRCKECAPDQFDALMASVNELRDNLAKSFDITGVGMGPETTAALKNPLQTPAEATAFLKGLNETVQIHTA